MYGIVKIPTTSRRDELMFTDSSIFILTCTDTATRVWTTVGNHWEDMRSTNGLDGLHSERNRAHICTTKYQTCIICVQDHFTQHFNSWRDHWITALPSQYCRRLCGLLYTFSVDMDPGIHNLTYCHLRQIITRIACSHHVHKQKQPKHTLKQTTTDKFT